MPGLVLDGETLTPEQVAIVAYDMAYDMAYDRAGDTEEAPVWPVSLSPEAVGRMTASRQVIEAVLTSGQTVYGVNTGFGALSHTRIPAEALDQLQLNLVRSHAAGTGPLLDVPVVRAMMLLRANALAKGVSGVRPVVVETLLALLNAGVHPVVPCQGSLGASGDLAPLAHLALVLVGEGEAFFRGQRLKGREALDRAGIAPLVLRAKEGLALLNGTQLMTALGALTLLKAETLLAHAEIAGAMTIEAVKGSAQPFLAEVAAVRPHPGHGESAAMARRLLARSEILESHRDCAKVQDPYSLRCIPQVHGAVRDALGYVRRVLSVEINAATDNPLVFPDGAIVSQGNFHGEPVALALDFMAIALAELASIAERRLDKLMNPVFSELPAFLVGEGLACGGGENQVGVNSGLMIAHYTAAALVSENKTLAHPAVVDSIPTSNDKEDHVSMGALAARKAAKILEHARWVVAAELLAAAQGLEFRGGLMPGRGVWAAYQVIRAHVPPLGADRPPAPDVATIAGLIDNGDILAAVAADA